MTTLDWIVNEASRGLDEGDCRDALTAIKWKIKDTTPSRSSAGIDDVEWLDAKVVQLSEENYALSASLRVMLALMENDIENGYVKAYETRQRIMAEARALCPLIKV